MQTSATREGEAPQAAQAVAAFIISKQAAGLADTTISKLEYALGKFTTHFDGQLPATVEEIEPFFAQLRRTPSLGEATRQLVFNATKQLYDFCAGRYGIDSPFDVSWKRGGLKRPSIRRRDVPSFSEGEALAILAANQGHPQRFAAVALMLDTACRPGEAYNLARSDVRGSYVIFRGKMGEERMPLTPSARDALDRWMTIHPGPGLWTQAQQRGFVNMLRRAFKTAGVKGFPYMLRHTTATLLTDAGVSLADVKQVLRHRTMTMTERYVEKSQSRAADALRRHGPLAHWQETYFQRPLHLVEDEGEKTA